MAASLKRVCWDACSWIAVIQRERIYSAGGKLIEDRYAMCRSVLDLAGKGEIEIVVSGLCLVEVNRPSPSAAKDQIVAFFDNDYILIVPVDQQVGKKARDIMFAASLRLKSPDAIHLATALVANVDELQTFDDRLLKQDGKHMKLDGTILKICKPS